MAHLKTINKLIANEFPFMELVKGNQYFYFAPIGSADAFGTEHRALGNLATASVYVSKISELYEDQWLDEARAIYEKMKNNSFSLCEKIKLKDDIEKQGTEYVVKYYEKDGSINTRNFTAITDGEAKESLTRYSDLKDVQLFKRIV